MSQNRIHPFGALLHEPARVPAHAQPALTSPSEEAVNLQLNASAASSVAPSQVASHQMVTAPVTPVPRRSARLRERPHGQSDTGAASGSITRFDRERTPHEIKRAKLLRNQALRDAASPPPRAIARPPGGVLYSHQRMAAMPGFSPPAYRMTVPVAPPLLPTGPRPVGPLPALAAPQPLTVGQRWVQTHSWALAWRGFTPQHLTQLRDNASATARGQLLRYVGPMLNTGYTPEDVTAFACIYGAGSFLRTLAQVLVVFRHWGFSGKDLVDFLWPSQAARRIKEFVQHPASFRTTDAQVRRNFLHYLAAHSHHFDRTRLDQFLSAT